MKKKILGVVLALSMIISVFTAMSITVSAVITESAFDTKVDAFISDSRWKDGVSWAAISPKLSTYSSSGCCAYAADFVAYVYGSKTYAWNTSDFTKFTDISEIRKGDIVYFYEHWFVVLDRDGDTLYTAEGNWSYTTGGTKVTRITTNGWSIKDGKIYNILAKKSSAFVHGFHYNFADREGSYSFSDYPAKMSVGDTDAVIALRLNKPSGTTISKYGARLYDANGNKIGSVSDTSSGLTSSTYSNMWWTVSTGMGVTLEPGTTYQFEFWATVDGTTYTSVRRYFATTGSQSVTMSFDANGGSGNVSSLTVAFNGEFTFPECTFTKTGYKFVGWNAKRGDNTWYALGQGWFTKSEIEAAGYTIKDYLAGQTLTFNASWTKGADYLYDYTFYARWEPITYTVQYNGNGATSGETESSTHTYNSAQALTASGFTREGYTFLGWSTSASATNATYTDKQSVENLTSTDGEVVNLYAVWKKDTVTETTKIVVGNVSGKTGENVTVPITISENPGIAGFKVKVNFDNTVLEPVSVEMGSALTSGTLTSNVQQGGDLSSLEYVSAFWSNPADMTSNGEILLVTFKIKDGAEDGTYPVTITYEAGDVTNQNFEDIGLDITNGSVEVVSVIMGDIFQDGKVNTKDSVKLNQYLADWDITFTSNEEAAADVFSDGKINTKDSVKLSQYLADWDVELMELFEVGGITFEAGSAEAVDGYVDIPVMITENSGVAGFKVKVNYDNTLLTPVSITKGEALTAGTMTSNIDQGGDLSNLKAVSVFWSNPANVVNTGVAFTVRFKVADGVDTDIPVTLSYEEGDICDQSFNDLTVVLKDGKVQAQKETDYTVKSLEGVVIDGSFYAEAEITKNTDRDAVDTIVIAVYKDGILIDRIYMRSKFAKGQNVVFGGFLEGVEGATFKAFVWDGMTSMNTLSNVIEK